MENNYFYWKLISEHYVAYMKSDLNKSHYEKDDVEGVDWTWYDGVSVTFESENIHIDEHECDDVLPNDWLDILRKGGNDNLQPITEEEFNKAYELAKPWCKEYEALMTKHEDIIKELNIEL